MGTVSEKAQSEKNETRELKRLGFVRFAAIQAIDCVSRLYGHAKRSSGPLRSTVSAVETAVAAVIGPVYGKIKDVPDDLLVFLDSKVDEASHKFDERAPPAAKKIVGTAQALVAKAAEKARGIASEAHTAGPRAAVSYAARESKQAAVDVTVTLWIALKRSPSAHHLTEKAGPAIALWSEKYNAVVKEFTEKGYPIFGYLPFVPVDEISKAIEQGEAVKDSDDLDASPEKKSDSSDSD